MYLAGHVIQRLYDALRLIAALAGAPEPIMKGEEKQRSGPFSDERID